VKLIRFRIKDLESFGILSHNNKVLNLPVLAKTRKRLFPFTLEGLISLGGKGVKLAEELVSGATVKEREKTTCKLDEVVLLAPAASPPKIICLGLNYKGHAEEQDVDLPEEPILFMKPRTTIIGPNEAIIKPSFVKQLDYEAELAIVIGWRGKDVPVSKARNHIFGYTAFNDVSARDIQFKDRQWTRGKSFDTFAPVGPCITTTNQLEDPNKLQICTRVNGELRQNESTSDMTFNVYEIVHQISRVMTLEPGDIIATGTPAGVGVFMKPKPKFLSVGDLVEVEIENIGVLKNKVAKDAINIQR
jgi:2-keto-4-pentenoate hydratase/2-oxohepta-3-ene-1,7-dioic acid hydratase in catechol pathway